MAERFLRTIIDEDVSISAGASPYTKDLPVNPLSFLLLTIRAVTLTANTVPTLANLLEVFSSVEVSFKGTTMVGASLVDLARLVMHLWRCRILRENINDDASNITWVTVPIPFGRIPFHPEECFPPTRKGDLTLKLNIASSFTNVGSVTIILEAVELLDAAPKRFTKITTTPKTPTATGEHEVDLPLGNPILGALIFGTTTPTGTSWSASVRKVKLLVDNVESHYSSARWESLHNDGHWRGIFPWDFVRHTHLENLAAAYTQNAESGAVSDAVREDEKYIFLDFDPLRDDRYLLETEGRGRIHLKITADVVDAIRVLPIELIRLPSA